MAWTILILAAVVAVAYANGANDIFKGVATLYGGGAVRYRMALLWAVVTTLAGSLLAAFFAQELIKMFSGAGLVPDAVLGDPAFVIAVALGAAFTVFFTAIAGVPISTTHSLTGALAGAGLMAAGAGVNFGLLGDSFFLPLAVSPMIAVGGVAILYPGLRWLTRRLGLAEDGCICITTHASREIAAADGAAMMAEDITVTTGDSETCDPIVMAPARLWRIDFAPVLRGLHFLSAGAVSFARGTNDTPKIAGLALLAGALDIQVSIFLIAGAMALGGLLHSRQIAETMAHRILPYNEAEGTLANLMTSVLVIGASRFGVPVSTTHVSVGALFGLGAAKGRAHWNIVGGIFLSWVLTLPVAMAMAALIYWLVG